MGFFTFGTGAGEAKGIMQQQQGLQKGAYDQFQSYMNQLRGAFSPYLSGSGQGYDPLQLALTKSQFLNKTAGDYQQAGSNVRTQLARMGSAGNGPVGGDYVRGIAGLEGGLANATSSGMAGINMSNLERALQNKFMAGQMLQGSAGQYGNWGSTFGSGMNNALNQYTHAVQSGFGGQFMSTLGKSLGAAAGGMAGGGLSGMMAGSSPAFPGMSPGAISASYGGPGMAPTYPSV